MRALIVLMAGCSFHGSGDVVVDAVLTDGRVDDGGFDAGDANGPVDALIDASDGCTFEDVVATKIYLPASTVDGTRIFTPSKRVALPAFLSVTLGNGGNHCAEIDLKRASDHATLRCRYVGGSSQAHPNNPTQALRGLRYDFGGCTTGAACPSPNGTPDPLMADALVGVEETLTVHVDNGDSYVGPTQVVAHVRVCP